MARQNQYDNDTSLSGLDRLASIKAENGASANITLDSLAQFLAESGNSDGTRAGFLYTYDGAYNTGDVLNPNKIKIEYLTGTPSTLYGFATVGALYFSARSEDGSSFEPVRSYVQSGILKLTNVTTAGSRGYGIYRVAGTSRVNNTGADDNSGDYIKLSLTPLASDGDIGLDKLVISPFGAGTHSGADPDSTDGFYADDGVPSVSLGQPGDVYFDTLNKNYYVKVSSSSWGNPRSLQGEQGPSGGAYSKVSAETTTKDAGTNAEVTVDVNDATETVEFTFGIPRGAVGPQGAQGIQGPQGISGTDGQDGSDGKDAVQPNWTFLSPLKVDAGGVPDLTVTGTYPNNVFEFALVTGDTGAAGEDGNTILYGTSDPTASQGNNGDSFINTTSHTLFGPKADGAWPAGIALNAAFDVSADTGTTIQNIHALDIEGGTGVTTTVSGTAASAKVTVAASQATNTALGVVKAAPSSGTDIRIDSSGNIIFTSNNTTQSGYVPTSDGSGGYTWAAQQGGGGGTDANDTTITLTAGTGLSGGGDFTTNQATAETLTFDVDPAALGIPSTVASTDGDYILRRTNNAYAWAQSSGGGGGDANQFAWSNFTIGGVTINANAITDTFTFVEGDNVSLVANATNKTLTINATDNNTFRPIKARVGQNTFTLADDEDLELQVTGDLTISENNGVVVFGYDAPDPITNTWRPITAGGNALGETESLTLTGGSNVDISESNGTVTISATDTNTTYTAGDGITITAANTVEHADTSTASSSSNSGQTVIQSITLDGFGHITAIGTTTIQGGGGSNDPVKPTVTLTQSGFSANSFPGTQSITYTATVVNNDGTPVKVTFSSTNSGFTSEEDTTIDDQNRYQDTLDTSFTTAGFNGSVVVTATLEYTLDGNTMTDVTDSITLQLAKQDPAYDPSFTYSGFEHTPTSTHIEAFDTGTITVSALMDTTDNDGWDVDSSGVTYTPTLNASREFTAPANANTLNFFATAGWDQTGSGTNTLSSKNYGTHQWQKNRSVRFGYSSSGSITQAIVEDLDNSVWSDRRFGTTDINGLIWMPNTEGNGDVFLYIITTSEINLIKSTDSAGQPLSGVWQKESSQISGFNVYRTVDVVAPLSPSDTDPYTITFST